MDHAVAAPALASVPLIDADGPAVDRLAALLTRRSLADGEVLYAQGEIGSEFALVLEGAVEVLRHDEVVRELEVAGPGSVLGELSLLTGAGRSATATATERVVVAEGGLDAFAALLEIPGVVDRLARLAAERMAHLVEVVEVGVG